MELININSILIFSLLIVLYLIIKPNKNKDKVIKEEELQLETNEVKNNQKEKTPIENFTDKIKAFDESIPTEEESILEKQPLNENLMMQTILSDKELLSNQGNTYQLTDTLKKDILKTVNARIGNLVDRVVRYDEKGRILFPLDAIDYINGNLKPIIMIDGTIRVQNLLSFEENIYLALEHKRPLFIINNCENKDKRLKKEIIKITPEQLDFLVLNDEKSKMLIGLDENLKEIKKLKKMNEEKVHTIELLENELELLRDYKSDSILSLQKKDNEIMLLIQESKLLREQLENLSSKLFVDTYIEAGDIDLSNEGSQFYNNSNNEETIEETYKNTEIENSTNTPQNQDLSSTLETKDIKNDNSIKEEKDLNSQENDLNKDAANSKQLNQGKKVTEDVLNNHDEVNTEKIKLTNELERLLGVKVEKKNEKEKVRKKPKYTKKSVKKIIEKLEEFIISDKDFMNQDGDPKDVKYFGFKKVGQNVDIYFSNQHLKKILKKILEDNYELKSGTVDTEIEFIISKQITVTKFFFASNKKDLKLYRFLISKITFIQPKFYGIKKGDIYSLPLTKEDIFELSTSDESLLKISNAIKNNRYLGIRA